MHYVVATILDVTRNKQFVEDHPVNIPTKFNFN